MVSIAGENLSEIPEIEPLTATVPITYVLIKAQPDQDLPQLNLKFEI